MTPQPDPTEAAIRERFTDGAYFWEDADLEQHQADDDVRYLLDLVSALRAQIAKQQLWKESADDLLLAIFRIAVEQIATHSAEVEHWRTLAADQHAAVERLTRGRNTP